jgi:hypothetical protein
MESLLLDARGNAFQGSLDAIGGETVIDARTAGGLLGAINAELVVDLNGKSTVLVDLRTAAGALTVVFEATLDGSNYFALPAFAKQQLLVAAIVQETFVPSVAVATTASGVYLIQCVGFRRFRVRVSAYTSGNITATLRATSASDMTYVRPVPTNLWITATAAANTNAVATLPAAGVGLFHYITSLRIDRNATAALVGSATIIHTSTNLPGSPAWSVGNNMIAGGTQIDVDTVFAYPLKSSVANTATTITAIAAGAAVLGRVNVGYYVGY